MKIALLSAVNSIHTLRWASALSESGLDVLIVSQHAADTLNHPDVRFRQLPHRGAVGYFRNAKALRKILREEQPDILHAHYASGYGTTARLANFRPTLLSVWGTDVYEFPSRSPLHKWLLRKNLLAVHQVASTSKAMALQTKRVAPELENIALTPFGVDTTLFSPRSKSDNGAMPVVIGTVKSLHKTYGIDLLLEAFALLLQETRQIAPRVGNRLRLRIVGEGPEKANLIERAQSLGIDKVTEFAGRVAHGDVPGELSRLDVYVALSRRESYGVAVVEASACGLPVVVSNVGGLPEVVVNGVSGYMVSSENVPAAATALSALVRDEKLRKQMGDAGRAFVCESYASEKTVRDMISLYGRVITASK